MATDHLESESTFSRGDYPDLDFEVFESGKESSHNPIINTNLDDVDIGITSDMLDCVVDEDLNYGPDTTTDSSLPSFTLSKCIICFQNIMMGESSSSIDKLKLSTKQEYESVLNDQPPEHPLHGFSKLFQISSTFYQNMELTPLDEPLFCWSCNGKISEGFNILREIERFKTNLERLKRDIQEELMDSCRSHPKGFQALLGDKHENASAELSGPDNPLSVQSKTKDRIRKAFAQCWTKATVPVRIPRPLRKGTKRRNYAEIQVKKVDVDKSDVDSLYEPPEHLINDDFTADNDVLMSSGEDYPFDLNSKNPKPTKRKRIQRKKSKRAFKRNRPGYSSCDEVDGESLATGRLVSSFQCEYCKREFKKEDYKTSDGEYVYNCDLPDCKTRKPFTSLAVLKKHHFLNCLLKPEFVCEHCKRHCFSQRTLMLHIRARHSTTKGAKLMMAKRKTGWSRIASSKSSKSSDAVKVGVGIGNPIVFFQCEFCKREFNLQDYRTEDGEYVFNCDLPDCKTKKPFTSLAVLKKHHSLNCLSKPEFICEHCSRRCFSARTLKLHLISKHPKNKVTGKLLPVRATSYTCDYCKTVFNRDDYKTENGKYLFRCELPNCRTSQPITLFHVFKRHHKKNCLSRPKYTCEHCGNNLYSSKALEEHIISQHTKQYEFTCEICGYAGVNATYLKRHMYFQHSDEKPFKCEMCPEAFKDKRMLLCHIRRHKNELPFVCEICGKGFPVVERFNKHKFVHETEKRFACPICNKLFRSPHYVDTHIWNSHKKARPKQNKQKQPRENQFDQQNNTTTATTTLIAVPVETLKFDSFGFN